MDLEAALNEIFALPVSERLRIIGTIWDSIAAESDKVPLTNGQKREIEDRLEEYRRDPSIAVPWEIARDRIRTKR